MKNFVTLPRFFSNLPAAMEQLPHISSALHESCYVLQLNFGFKHEKTQYTVRSCSEMVVRPLPLLRDNRLHIVPDQHNTSPQVYKLAQLPQQLVIAIHEHKNTPYRVPTTQAEATEPQNPDTDAQKRSVLRNHVDLSSYPEFHKKNMGFNFINTQTAKVVTKFDIYLDLYQNAETQLEFVAKLNSLSIDNMPDYMRIDKPGWRNGQLLKKR